MNWRISAPSRRLFSCRARVFQIKIFSGLIYSSLQSSKGGFINMIARADIVFLRVCAVTHTMQFVAINVPAVAP
jgi:hypothetical protein